MYEARPIEPLENLKISLTFEENCLARHKKDIQIIEENISRLQIAIEALEEAASRHSEQK